jgi:2-succinyl-5-enolpyruvyl-6-hydroxy-3-cyclohexene-1-carboxylate synthase
LDFEPFSRKLSGKKILVICGQSVLQTNELKSSLENFLKRYNAVLLTDYMSNCHVEGAIKNSLATIHSIKQTEIITYIPDIVITLGGNYIFNVELKQLLAQGKSEHWLVGPEGEVCDPFHNLTEIFEMEEFLFFSNVNKCPVSCTETSFTKLWHELAAIPEPSLTKYDEIYVIGKLIKSLPKCCDLQLANSNTIRMAQFFSIPAEIRVNCNRGVNGIDGSMSTAIGFSASTDRLVYYITGDLSFFYDMNSLWIKHISSKMRILLINNDGGGFMYHKFRIVDGKKSITLAAENKANAKGWVESLGFKYISAHNQKEYDVALNVLTDETINVPVIVEAFTDLATDGNITSEYFGTLDRRSFSEKVQGRLTHIVNSVFSK